MMNIKGVIFDFDGTILDTESPFFEVWQDTFRTNGIELTLTEWADSLGSSTDAFNPVNLLKKKTGKTFHGEDIWEVNHQKALKTILQQPPLPGVHQFLKDAKQLGLKLAVASSSDRDWVRSHLKRLHLLDFFSHVCAEEDVPQVKPDPALFQCAMSKLNLEPEEVIVIEDTPHGITAANRAGIYCIAVPNALTRQLDVHHADMVLDSLDQIPLNSLLNMIQTDPIQ